MESRYQTRRILAVILLAMTLLFSIFMNHPEQQNRTTTESNNSNPSGVFAAETLEEIAVKGRAPKTDYSRDQFGADWKTINGCSMRNIILQRDLEGVVTDNECNVISGILYDPYTGKEIIFHRGSSTSGQIQIDHVVALSDAWQKGAQQMTYQQRIDFANDPLELMAVDGSANQQKSGSDAASWLPKNKSFRCEYVSRQIAVKKKYSLWVTMSEKTAILSILDKCPRQMLPSP